MSLLEQGKSQKWWEKNQVIQKGNYLRSCNINTNLKHNQLSVKLFSNAHPGTDTTFNYNRCSLEF